MFYELQVLSRKGALATVWIAAHLEKRLKRQHVADTDIPQSAALIMNSNAPFALRLSSQLLFGIVRVYHRKVAYLLQDCHDAFSKIQEAFVKTTLPGCDLQTAYESLALPPDLFKLSGIESVLDLPQEIIENEMDPFVEAFGRIEDPSRLLLAPEMLQDDEKEFPPLMEIIPQEEIVRDVMREVSISNSQHRLPSEIEATRDSTHSIQDDDFVGRFSALSKDRISEIKDLPLPELNLSPLASQSAKKAPPMPDLTPATDKMAQSVQHGPKQGLKKSKMIIDRKNTLMTNSQYKMMHKRRNRLLHKKSYQHLLRNAELYAKGDEALEKCHMKEVQKLDMLNEVWTNCTLKNLPTVQPTEENSDEKRATLDPFRNKRKDFGSEKKYSSLSPAGPMQDLDPTALLAPGSLEESVPRSPLMESFPQNLDDDHHPARNEDQMPMLSEIMEPMLHVDEDDQNLNRLRNTKCVRRDPSQSFSHHSHVVLSHVRNVLSCGSEDDDELCTSPKRRRLSNVVKQTESKTVSLADLIKEKSRSDASRWFYELLVLKSHGLVQLKQMVPYGDIAITLP